MRLLQRSWRKIIDVLSNPAWQGASFLIALIACILTLYSLKLIPPATVSPTSTLTPGGTMKTVSPPPSPLISTATILADTQTSLSPVPTVTHSSSALTEQIVTLPSMPNPTSTNTLTTEVPSTSFKEIGGVYGDNGITITLTKYDIRREGTIWLTFSVANSGTSEILLRYENDYFSLSDDTGRTYTQVGELLHEPKQLMISANQYIEFYSEIYPEASREISFFTGKVPEEANFLIVRISQFAELRDLQWRIPLNSESPSAQSPVPGTRQEMSAGFSANGITMSLIEHNIESNERIWIRFRVRNDANNAVLIRYRNEYFELSDDLSNNYTQVQELLSEPKQILLRPGESMDFYSEIYPETPPEISFFTGKIPEEASFLVVHVSQFAGLRDLQWRIPLNSESPSTQSPASGTQQEMSAGFSANGITMSLINHKIESNGRIWITFRVRNDANNAVLIRYRNEYFELSDDLGNDYTQVQELLSEPKQILLQAGKSMDFYSEIYPENPPEISFFTGKISEAASFLIVRVSQFAGLRDLQWRIPLN